MAARYAVDDFNGPQEGVRRITAVRDRHRFYCNDCIAIKRGKLPLTGEGCPVDDAYATGIAAMKALYEIPKGGV